MCSRRSLIQRLNYAWPVTIGLVLLTAVATAQPPSFGGRGGFGGPPGGGFGGPPGGGRDRGGDRGDRGGRGGDRGGRGGDQGGGGPSSFLARMDRNGDGLISPDELDDRSRGFVERMAQSAGLNASRPIPLDRLNQAFEQMRSGMRGGGGDSGRGGSSRGGSSNENSEEEKPLVAGFDLPEIVSPPGFGEGAELFQVAVTDKDLAYAKDRFNRYDRNKDGTLDQNELRGGRWSDDPLRYDRNKDGKLSVNEMAVRYAQRRVSESGGSNQSQATAPYFTAQVAGGSTAPLDENTQRMLDFTMGRYDSNKDGVIDKDEAKQMRSDPSGSDRNKDGKLTKDELAGFSKERFGNRGNRGSSGTANYFTGSTQASADGGEQLTSYRQPTMRERLEEAGLLKDLPSGFLDADVNQDGQVAMAEFATDWSDDLAENYMQFDRNNDGFITVAECIDARKDGAKWQGDDSSAGRGDAAKVASNDRGGRDRGGRGSRGADSDGGSASRSEDSKPASAGAGDIPATYIRYAEGLIKKYDSDGDGVLVEDEWNKMAKSPEEADTDKDGKITSVEMAKFKMQ